MCRLIWLLVPNGRRASRHIVPALGYLDERPSSRVAINAENSALVERFRRDRVNVRPYVRTSSSGHHELCFMRPVEKLGGQDSKLKSVLVHFLSSSSV